MSKRLLHISLIVIAAGIVFFNTFSNDFHTDDFYRVVDNPGIQTISSPFRHFVDPQTMSTLPRIVQYRPLLPLTLSINFWLHEYQLPGYHLVNLLIHIIAGIFVYLLCFELLKHWVQNEYTEKRQHNIAFISSLLFTIHPVSGILVNYICSRDLLLMQMFLLGSFLAYVRMRRLGMTSLRWVVVVLLFSFSMLSKTNGVAFPALIIIFDA